MIPTALRMPGLVQGEHVGVALDEDHPARLGAAAARARSIPNSTSRLW